MTTLSDNAVRETAVYGLAPGAVARGQNFFVQWLEGRETPYPARSGHEMLLLLPDDGAQVRVGDGGWQAVPGRSVCVLPAGDAAVQLKPNVRAALLASSRPDLAQDGIANAADYAEPDPRIIAGDSGYRRTHGHGELQVIAIDAIRPPADKPRLKMLQTETLSINWVEYQDARDRSSLSPHSHADFEQGSLAIDGHFIHHLRVQWGPNADQWRDDQHLQAGPASMMTIPVQMIHTTEGVGPGRHLLIDVFSPPRQDFIGKGWVANAADYGRA